VPWCLCGWCWLLTGSFLFSQPKQTAFVAAVRLRSKPRDTFFPRQQRVLRIQPDGLSSIRKKLQWIAAPTCLAMGLPAVAGHTGKEERRSLILGAYLLHAFSQFRQQRSKRSYCVARAIGTAGARSSPPRIRPHLLLSSVPLNRNRPWRLERRRTCLQTR